ncbi:MAG: hypothetical protein Q8M31_24100 [Beijerinckiaceae bacterium]|nr:hypothetical protein [Beijerinckiaceae bacterium]
MKDLGQNAWNAWDDPIGPAPNVRRARVEQTIRLDTLEEAAEPARPFAKGDEVLLRGTVFFVDREAGNALVYVGAKEIPVCVEIADMLKAPK